MYFITVSNVSPILIVYGKCCRRKTAVTLVCQASTARGSAVTLSWGMCLCASFTRSSTSPTRGSDSPRQNKLIMREACSLCNTNCYLVLKNKIFFHVNMLRTQPMVIYEIVYFLIHGTCNSTCNASETFQNKQNVYFFLF